MKAFNYEIYTKNPITGEGGFNIRFVSVFAEDHRKAKEVLRSVPNFDIVILFNFETDLDDREEVFYSNGHLYIWTDGGSNEHAHNVDLIFNN
jgi:hypothetical protein